VAEGVESAEDAAFLRAEGIGYLQGYHLGPPTIERAWLGEAPSEVAGMHWASLRMLGAGIKPENSTGEISAR
jgi:hypothetical protein